MNEDGEIKKGRTQVGDVKRPLAAVSELTNNNQIGFFCKGEDWIIDRSDPVAAQIIQLVRQARRKTRMYEHRGTYRMRAWLIPEGAKEAPFGRQEA